MSYSKLYNSCQELEPTVGRTVIRAKIFDITGVKFKMRRMRALDPKICRGMYLSGENTDHPVVKQHGGHVIAIAHKDSLGAGWYCWERFIGIKEMMHVFDNPKEAADSGEVFDNLLNEFAAADTERSPQMESELSCFWKALGVLCPEKDRAQFASERQAGKINDYGIASKLRVPEIYVPRLFETRYSRIIKDLTK